ncbi:cytochrome c/FTR1 family iron permease [Pelomonas sp. Root1444]|uniref:cytochrome c/FTR1 family iron permease n=1 Tax=Pelomonas sp. Root1444 TaxID=1736464 RepID=UPI0007024275|nr:cytochrome c/FTR1 family iron permease [Pelomonas sp. Root1444]KQY80884.1 iron permease [Pelomonas sp. Root1444]
MSLTKTVQRSAKALAVLAAFIFSGVSQASEADVKRVWQILDYLAVDYAGAVKEGKVVSQSEYDEMKEFVLTARTKIEGLEARGEKAALIAQATELEAAIGARAEASKVGTLSKALARHLVATYPVPLAPSTIPDVALGAKVYAENCASCHGTTGNGLGPVGKALNPLPVAFTDKERARQRSLFALYQAVSQGIAGTAMPAFGQLSEEDRWAVATYLGTFAHDGGEVGQGKKVWAEGEKAKAAVPNVDRFVGLTQNDLAESLGEKDASAVMAYLHANPDALSQAATGSLSLARKQLKDSLAAYKAGDLKKAQDLALSSYLDGVEPYEHALAAKDGSLRNQIEVAMGRYRSSISDRSPVDQVAASAADVEQLFTLGDKVLADSKADWTAAFLGSLTILLREGLEALLVVVAMIAFLRKAERPDVLGYVHAGWVTALLAGAATWGAATYLVTISGANREVTEGLSSLFAAAVLVSVGVWMHQKSVAGQWQAYLRERMSAALNRKSAFFMFGLAFIAVYREVFETILFYAALWGQGNDHAILAGLAAGILALVAITVLLLRFSATLPIGKFFSASSWLVAVLAVVLTGKGVAALQEAGWIVPSALPSPRLELLGVYPSTIGLAAQAVVLAFVLGFFLWHGRASSKPEQQG